MQDKQTALSTLADLEKNIRFYIIHWSRNVRFARISLAVRNVICVKNLICLKIYRRIRT